MSSQQVEAIDRYSASIEDLKTVCCFFDFQEMRESPRNIQNPKTDRLVLGHPAQSESQNALRRESDEEEKNKPWLGEDFKNHNT